MSSESVVKFVMKVGEAPTLQRQVDSLNGDLDGLVKLAAASGFSFSSQEWVSTVSGMRDARGTVASSPSATFAEVQARFACFPPIGTIRDVSKGR